MYNLSDIDTVKSILTRHGFTFSKALGQNFLVNDEVCPAMAEEAVRDSETGVIEIGAGVGVLTAELCKRAKKVVSVELDKRLLPVLEETLADFDNFEVVNADVLKLDLKELIKDKFVDCRTVNICANLPYYITSPVIMKLLEDELPVENIIVMVQKEAADRLTAKVGTRNSGAITVAVNYYAQAQKLFDVYRDSFVPSPKVDSAVIKLSLYDEVPFKVDDEAFFFKMVKAIFMQRRKTASNGISAGLGIDKQKITDTLVKLGLNESVRAEALSFEELCALSNELCK